MLTLELDTIIFEARGWVKRGDGKKWKSEYARSYWTWRRTDESGAVWYVNEVPCFSQDLNLMHRAVKDLCLAEKRAYSLELGLLMQKDLQVEQLEPLHLHEAPSSVRARAYVEMLRRMRPEEKRL